ncbi:hypothetical protein D3C78_1172980 [compost metagenome]
MPGEILRGADHRHAHVGADAHRDHVLGDLLAEADASVVALRHDVGQTVVHDDLDVEIGIVGQQLREYGLQDGDRGMLAGRDAQFACRLVAEFAEQGQFVVDFVEPGGDHPQQMFTRFRGRNASRGACKQPDAESFLQLTHGPTQGGLRHAELGRGAGEAALLGHDREDRELVVAFSGHSYALL